MFYPDSRSFRQFNSIAHSFVQGEGLPLRDVLAEGVIDRIAAEEGVCFGSTLTTALVLWAFVTQAISKDQTCLAAVARIITVLVGSGREACSSHTGGYCKARQKLPEKFLRRLTIEVGQRVEDQAAEDQVRSLLKANTTPVVSHLIWGLGPTNGLGKSTVDATAGARA